ncbi:hypothetical protein Tco_0052230 [Tanacetum coccineum]
MEMLKARENLMETIQAFLKEYDHISPEEKCMALLLADERFLKIKQAMEEDQNQPEVMQELLLKLMNGLQILKGIQPKQAEQEEQATKSFTSYGNFSMIDDVKVLQDRENLMKDIQTFLRKFSHVRNINEELFEFINSPSWNRPTFYNDDDEYTVIYRKPKVITPDLPIEEPDNSLSMGDEHLNIIPETEKSSVENFVPIPSESKGIPEDICDVPSCDNDHFDAEFGLINSLLSRDSLITSPKIDFLPEEFAGELDLIDPILPGIDDDNFDEEEGEIDIDIFQIEDEILREKLLNVNLLMDKIEALNLTPSKNLKCVLPIHYQHESDSHKGRIDIFSSPMIRYHRLLTVDIELRCAADKQFDELKLKKTMFIDQGRNGPQNYLEDFSCSLFYSRPLELPSPLLAIEFGKSDILKDYYRLNIYLVA